jgi:hypothetical protein
MEYDMKTLFVIIIIIGVLMFAHGLYGVITSCG